MESIWLRKSEEAFVIMKSALLAREIGRWQNLR
jgi:hypothetical protein